MSGNFLTVIAYGMLCMIVFARGLIWCRMFLRHTCKFCQALCQEKFNGSEPVWVCTECRNIQ